MPPDMIIQPRLTSSDLYTDPLASRFWRPREARKSIMLNAMPMIVPNRPVQVNVCQNQINVHTLNTKRLSECH